MRLPQLRMRVLSCTHIFIILIMLLEKNIDDFPANTRHLTKVDSMLGRRRRRRANIEPTLVKYHVVSGLKMYSHGMIFVMLYDL